MLMFQKCAVGASKSLIKSESENPGKGKLSCSLETILHPLRAISSKESVVTERTTVAKGACNCRKCPASERKGEPTRRLSG